MLKGLICSVALAATAACAGVASVHADQGEQREGGSRSVKVMIISMFRPEGQVWLERLGPWQEIKVPGLSANYPDVHCNRRDVCVLTTGMGYANAAASTMALVFSHKFNLKRTYFIVAGIAGIDPSQGTVGSAAWARYLVDFGIQWELDGRELPPGWNTGYLGVNTKSPSDKPSLDYRTEVFRLNETFLQKAFALSRGVRLSDSAQAQAARAKYGYAPANQPPGVIQCDTLADDTWWSGTLLGQRARDWTKTLTGGKGVYCTTQQEDNATYEALTRGASANLVDLSRVAVLRAGADFDRPYAGQTSEDNLLDYAAQGGFTVALQNLYLAGNPVVQDIVTHWRAWRDGPPSQ
jgi:purine nucleoside permease